MFSPGYLPIAVFFVVAAAFPFVALFLARLIRPHHPNTVKLQPYECGIETVSDARSRISIHFYLVAVLFVVFDVEIVFLFPWAVRFRELGLFGFGEMLLFLAILLAAYGYAWRKGALDWK